MVGVKEEKIQRLRFHSYRSERRKIERTRVLIELKHRQREQRKDQQKFRRMVSEIIAGSPRENVKKWWNNVVRESSNPLKSMLIRKLLGRVRHNDVGKISDKLLTCFRSLEEDILSQIDAKGNKGLKSCRGAKTLGLSLGCTFVPGHKKIYSKSPFQRENQALVNELKGVTAVVFEEAFGGEEWFVNLKRKVRDAVFAIHGFEGLECLFGGLPISCVWLSLKPQQDTAHVDVNTGPATFVMTTTNCNGGDLVITSPMDGSKRRIHLKPGQMLGGSWALFKHWNMKVQPNNSDGTEGQRHSWVFYLNRNLLNIGDWKIVSC